VLLWQAGHPPARLPLPDLSAWSIFQPIAVRRPWTPPDSPLPAVAVWDPLADLTAQNAAPGDGSGREGAGERPQGQGGGDAMLTVEDLGPMGPLFAEGQEAPIDPDDVAETRTTTEAAD
jgi:hypothetical protein